MIDPQSERDPDRTRPSPSPLRSLETIGPYRLLQRVGQGGMGEVWLAEQTLPVRRQVAIKIIKAGMDTAQVVARFDAERQALALMSHPAIAQVFDAGATPEGRPFFAMEYVPGEPITTYCNRHRLTTGDRIDLFLEVCEGVQHAHQKGVIHRDLKPSNVLVAVRDDRPVPKIIDFGVAKATTAKLTDRTLYTELGILIGTPEYMSPEQAEMTGLDIDTRTDVYALGVILYELLTGALPFESKMLRERGIGEIGHILRNTDPPRPSTRVMTLIGEAGTSAARDRQTDVERLATQLRGDLDAITMKALEKDRTRRYGSVSELAADLRRHLDNVPVLASPPSTVYRVSKFVRRHRFGVTVATVALLLLVAFATAMAIQARRIARERDRAEQVAQFLVSLFEASDPNKTKGEQLTARDLLDRGVARLEVELRNEPQTRSSLLYSIGRTYLKLGRFDEAQRVLEQAVPAQRTLTGRDRVELAKTLNALAAVLYYKGDLTRAADLNREVLGIRQSVLGPNHPEVANSLHNLASIAAMRGRNAEAAELYVQTIATMKKARDSAGVVLPLQNLSRTLAREGKLTEAIAAARESVAMAERTFGSEHSETLGAMNALGQALNWHGDYREAEQVQREALARTKKIFGNDHYEVANSCYQLATTLIDEQELDEAEQLLRNGLAIFGRTMSTQESEKAWSLDSLGWVELYRGRYASAEQLFQQAVAIFQAADTDKTNVGKPWYGLGEVAYRRGQWSDAEKYWRMDLELVSKSSGAPANTLAWPKEALGRLLTEQNRADEAEPLLREGLEQVRKDLPPDHWRVAYAEVLLGDAIAHRGRAAEAEPLLLSGANRLADNWKGRDETRDALKRIAAFYETTGQGDKATMWRTKIADTNTKNAETAKPAGK